MKKRDQTRYTKKKNSVEERARSCPFPLIPPALSCYRYVCVCIYFVFCEHNLCESKTKDFANVKWEKFKLLTNVLSPGR